MPHRFLRWRDALLASPSEHAVASVIQEYLHTVTPEMLAMLSEECRRALLSKTLDIPTIAITLMHAELAYRGDPETAEVLHELAHTFAAAATRLRDVTVPVV